MKRNRHSFISWSGFVFVIFFSFFFKAPQATSLTSGGGGNPATDCIINSFYQVAGTSSGGSPFQNRRMHFWLSPLCTSAVITPPGGNTNPVVVMPGITDSAGNHYGYADTDNTLDIYNGTYTLNAGGATAASATLQYNAFFAATCALAWTNFTALPTPHVNWSANACSGATIRFNGVVNNTGGASLQTGINTVTAQYFNITTAQYYIVDTISINSSSGSGSGGGGGGGGGTATIAVNVVGIPIPKAVSWDISPGGAFGKGSVSPALVVNTPSSGSVPYTLSYSYLAGTCSVTNDSGSTSGNIIPIWFDDGGSTYTYTLSCTPNTAAVINVASTNCAASGLSWVINPGPITDSGTSGSYSVTPGALTTYTIVPSVTSGTITSVSNTATGVGPSMSLIVGDNETFNIMCAAASAPTVTLNAAPTTITSGGSSTLTWSTTGATSCTASGAWTGSKATAGSLSVSPVVNSTYSISCSGLGGSANTSATVTVNPPVPVVTISASPTSGTVNVVNPTITWSATNSPTSCTAVGDWSGAKAVAGGSQLMGVLTTVKTYSYTLTCANAGGSSAPVTATVVVSAVVAAPVVTLTRAPIAGTVNVVNPTLTWSVTNSPTSCTAGGDWSGAKAIPSGSQVMGVLTTVKTYSYTLTCTNAGGTNAKTVTVVVSPPIPVVTISANPTSGIVNVVNPALTWSSTNSPTSCTASGDWSGNRVSANTLNMGVLTTVKTYTYTLACNNGSGTSTPAVATVVVNPVTTANISIVSNLATSSWTINPGAISGAGSGSTTVSPGASGTLYTFTPAAVAGYTSVVSPGSSQLIFPGDTPTFTVTYTPVVSVPVVTLTASPTSGTVNSVSPVLVWSSTNSPTSCTASGDWSGTKASSGSLSMGVLTTVKTYTYTLVCANAGGSSAPVSATVDVTSVVPPPVVTLTASPTIGVVNVVNPTLTWTVTGSNIASCTASGDWSGSKAIAGGSASMGVLTVQRPYTYSIFCTTGGGVNSVAASVVVTAIAPSPVITISASPGSGTVNVVNPTITWSATNSPTSCTASGDWSGAKAVGGGSQAMGVLNTVKTYTYTLTCANAAGSSPPTSTTVVVSAATPVPVVSINASVVSGTVNVVNPTISWSATNSPTSCTASGDWSGAKNVLGGSQSMGVLTTVKTYSYTLVCANAGGNSAPVSDTVVVTAAATAPTVTISATPTTINLGQSSTLTWSTTNATSCTASGAWSGSQATAGSLSVSPLSNSTYSISCSGPGGSANTFADITVNTTADISVTSNLSTAGWTITPGAISGTGSGSTTVSPGASGTLYTFTPAVVAGYTSVVSPGSSQLVFPGDTPTFTVTYTPVASIPVVTLTASPTTGVVNVVNPTLTWTTTNSPTSCIATGDWSGSKAVGGGSQSMGVLTTVKTYTYTLTCTNAGGSSVPVSATVVVSAAVVAPVITLTASPTTGVVNVVNPTITWSVANSPTSCTASNKWSGSKNINGGSQSMGVLTIVQTYTYTLTCTNAAGTTAKSVNVVVTPPVPVVTISANPTTGVVSVVNPTLTWTTTNTPTLCLGSGDWVGSKNVAGGSQVKGILNTVKTFTFTLECKNGAGSSTPVSATVVVDPATVISVSSNRSSAGWTINPGAFSGTGSGSANVVPGGSGTLYTITPATVSGFTYTVSPGSSIMAFTGDTPTFTVTYTAIVPAFDYSISATNATITQGQVGQSTVTENLVAGVTQDVYLSVAGLPTGVGVAYTSQPCKPTCSQNVNLTVGGTASPGTYPITVNADTSPAGTAKSTTFTLTINPAPALSITCTASPTSAQVNQVVTWTANVTGGIPPMTYDWTGTDFPTSPDPSTNPYTFTYQTVGPKSVQVAVTDSIGNTASCPATILQIGVKPDFKEF